MMIIQLVDVIENLSYSIIKARTMKVLLFLLNKIELYIIYIMNLEESFKKRIQMQNKKVQKLLIFELVIMIVQLILSIFFDNIYLRTMGEGTRTIIVRSNFLSYMTWGYGNFFPILFIASLLLAGIILINALRKSVYAEDKLSSNIVIFGGILFLMTPLLIGMQQINIGLIVMVTVQFIIFALNMIRTRN